MKAITLWQPYASLVAAGVKTIETRSWPAPKVLIGQRIAIHAAARDTDRDAYEHPAAWIALGEHIGGDAPPRGAIVASAVLTDCVPMVDDYDDRCSAYSGPAALEISPARSLWLYPRWDSGLDDEDITDVSDQLPFGDFAPGRWAWLLDDIKPCDPIPAKGKQRVWEWTP